MLHLGHTDHLDAWMRGVFIFVFVGLLMEGSTYGTWSQHRYCHPPGSNLSPVLP